MTLQNGMIWRDEVRLYCDTVALEMPSAKIYAFASKAIHGLAAPYAVTATLIERPDRAQGILPLANAVARVPGVADHAHTVVVVRLGLHQGRAAPAGHRQSARAERQGHRSTPGWALMPAR